MREGKGRKVLIRIRIRIRISMGSSKHASTDLFYLHTHTIHYLSHQHFFYFASNALLFYPKCVRDIKSAVMMLYHLIDNFREYIKLSREESDQICRIKFTVHVNLLLLYIKNVLVTYLR